MAAVDDLPFGAVAKAVAHAIVRAGGGIVHDSKGRAIYKRRWDRYIVHTIFDPYHLRAVHGRIRVRITYEYVPAGADK